MIKLILSLLLITLTNCITVAKKSEYTLEGELRSEVQTNIKRLMDIGCYRGIRHRKGLPLDRKSVV